MAYCTYLIETESLVSRLCLRYRNILDFVFQAKLQLQIQAQKEMDARMEKLKIDKEGGGKDGTPTGSNQILLLELVSSIAIIII